MGPLMPDKDGVLTLEPYAVVRVRERRLGAPPATCSVPSGVSRDGVVRRRRRADGGSAPSASP
jgi:hypothetical protein